MHVLIAALHRPIKPTGVCRHAVNLAQCLASTNEVDKVTLVIGAWQLNYFKTSFVLDSPKIDLVSIELKNSSLSRNIWFVWGLAKLTNQLCPDLVHLSFPIPFWRSLFSCPVVTTIHDFYPYECPENFGYPNVWFNRWFLKQCVENSSGLSCVSQITLKNLNRYLPKISSQKLTTVIYNCVDFSQITPAIPTNIDSKYTESFLLCVGQHRQNKNLDLLIKAYVKLRNSNQITAQTKLIIIGATGPETEKLHSLIDYFALQELVLLESSINDSNLTWLYQNCELFIIASSTEGFCLPLAEAIYFASKVVCTDISVFREIGANNCTYFQLEGDSVSNLSNAIASTLNQSRADCDLHNYRFSKSKIAEQYVDFYAQLI
ncbi:glycosyltransferase family 4 protein [Pleurocapsa sp. FMAR1]|uniref:glycosyltransferase family 4 protein n=1 Tax=Pleurocapsa sp. FMAR1 TaxID=3040204 RepID=UPI0029C748B4|nr:glycosyltransferase family 1 protein [Pleurocapsa sp. FMAR1]